MKIREKAVEVVFELLDGEPASDSVVSGPDSVNNAETLRVRVYGGPYEPLFSLVLVSSGDARVHVRTGAFVEWFAGRGMRRSRFWPGAFDACIAKGLVDSRLTI